MNTYLFNDEKNVEFVSYIDPNDGIVISIHGDHYTQIVLDAREAKKLAKKLKRQIEILSYVEKVKHNHGIR